MASASQPRAEWLRASRYLSLLRRMGDQDLRRDQSFRSFHVQLHVARTGRRVRTDHSLEWTDRDVRMEDCAVVGLWQRIDYQTGRADAAYRAAPWRADSGGRHP